MKMDLEKFFDKNGNERPPYKWELKQRGFSANQIRKISLPYKTSGFSNFLLPMTTVIGLVITLR